MMKNTTNYGKIIAITLSIVISSCAIAFVLYRLFRNLIAFCNTYRAPQEEEDLDFSELENSDFDDEADEEVDEAEEIAE